MFNDLPTPPGVFKSVSVQHGSDHHNIVLFFQPDSDPLLYENSVRKALSVRRDGIIPSKVGEEHVHVVHLGGTIDASHAYTSELVAAEQLSPAAKKEYSAFIEDEIRSSGGPGRTLITLEGLAILGKDDKYDSSLISLIQNTVKQLCGDDVTIPKLISEEVFPDVTVSAFPSAPPLTAYEAEKLEEGYRPRVDTKDYDPLFIENSFFTSEDDRTPSNALTHEDLQSSSDIDRDDFDRAVYELSKLEDLLNDPTFDDVEEWSSNDESTQGEVVENEVEASDNIDTFYDTNIDRLTEEMHNLDEQVADLLNRVFEMSPVSIKGRLQGLRNLTHRILGELSSVAFEAETSAPKESGVSQQALREAIDVRVRSLARARDERPQTIYRQLYEDFAHAYQLGDWRAKHKAYVKANALTTRTSLIWYFSREGLLEDLSQFFEVFASSSATTT